MSIKITKATWDKRPKTKFLRVEGLVEVMSFEDTTETKISEQQGLNEKILLIDVNVIESSGLKKPQMAPFYLPTYMTTGAEVWTHVQVRNGDESDTSPITVLKWAGSPECI